MKKYLILIYILLPIVFACEYVNEKQFYVEVTKPDDKEIVLNLAGFPNGATIYIYKRTQIVYQLTLPEGELLKKRFTLNGEELIQINDYIVLEPTVNARDTRKLTLDIEIDSGSESIAGKLGLENYVGKFEFTIVFIPDAVLHLDNIAHHKNENDYFELTWDKPLLEQCTVEKYRITCYHNRNEYVREITDPDKTYFVDSMAVFGTLQYRIETFFKEAIREPWIDIYTTEIEFPESSVHFEYTGVNSGKISWPKNEYRSKYAFAIGYYGEIVYEGTDNYFEIDNIIEFTRDVSRVFPFEHGGNWVELYILPVTATEISRDSPIHYDMLFTPSLITLEENRGEYKVFTDSSKENIFVKNGKELWVYDSNDLMLQDHTIADALPGTWNNRAYCSENSSRMLFTYDDWIELVSYDFANQERIAFDAEEKLDYQQAFFGSNDVVYIRPVVDILPEGEPEVEGKLYAFDLNTHKLINYFTFPNKWEEIVVSGDGKYVAIFNDFYPISQVSVYQFSYEGYTLIYHEDFQTNGQINEDKGVYFNEKISNQLLITLAPGSYSNETYAVNLENGTKTPKKRTSYICSDPYTGNIVTMHGNDCVIYDQTFTRELFNQERTDIDHLYHNYIFTSGWGSVTKLYYLDITNYLER